ncbi:MAG: ABC transporter permease, partial [Clostridia bacterium]|nr:ABC transporter permease [Clostridia bacterium]
QDMQLMLASLPPEQQAMMAQLPPEQQMQMMAQYAPKASDATLEGNLSLLGVSQEDDPSSIYLYPIDFEAKEEIEQLIAAYNEGKPDDQQIRYTDYVGLMMSSVTTIVNAISYILIAFVAISLVVSSIMIGIITYISVLERTKEIGILRAIGASKRDISRVFNAETLIVGFTAGALGIGVTLLLNLLVNHIIFTLTSIPNAAGLPPLAGLILVGISMVLTFIAGLIPSRLAAKKDPVVALRTE